jgi:hypothetical protein
LELRWYGPYRWYGTNDACIFAIPEAEKPGIYLWTIPFESGYLAYYVGETGRPFADRFIEHTRDYLYGFYRVYDPKEFAKGKKTLVWDGMWKSDRRDMKYMLEFLNRYLELSQVVYEFLGQLRIFVGPLDVKERIRQRIEATLADSLRKQPGLIGKFQDADIRYRKRQANEKPISVTMTSNEQILGLCNELIA